MKRFYLFSVFILLFLSMISGCSYINNEVDFPPLTKGYIKADGEEYVLKQGAYKWERVKQGNGEVFQTDAASPEQMAEEIDSIAITPNENITIHFEEDPDISVYLWDENGRQAEIPLDNNIMTTPSKKGVYIYEVMATYEKIKGQDISGEVSHTFVIEI